MAFLSVLLIAWGIVLACLLALLTYNASVTRYAGDQLFVNDFGEIEKVSPESIQEETLKKAGRIQPYIRAFASLSFLMTLSIAGVMSWIAFQHLRR